MMRRSGNVLRLIGFEAFEGTSYPVGSAAKTAAAALSTVLRRVSFAMRSFFGATKSTGKRRRPAVDAQKDCGWNELLGLKLREGAGILHASWSSPTDVHTGGIPAW